MGDLDWLGLYAASKVFDHNSFGGFTLENRKYSFNGEVIYDFNRKSYARVFPVTNDQFKIFDYMMGNYLTVSRSGDYLGLYSEK